MQVIQIQTEKAASIVERLEEGLDILNKAAAIVKSEEIPVKKAELLKIFPFSKSFYEKHINEIPKYKIGNVGYFYPSEVNAWIKRKSFKDDELGQG